MVQHLDLMGPARIQEKIYVFHASVNLLVKDLSQCLTPVLRLKNGKTTIWVYRILYTHLTVAILQRESSQLVSVVKTVMIYYLSQVEEFSV